MNQKRINKVLEKMEERGIDYLLVTDPVSIDYLLDYVNHPGERMYVMVLSSKGNHQLFFNNLFYVGEDLVCLLLGLMIQIMLQHYLQII